jgi:Mn-dependent DtxR family transcriptional regulator
LVSTIRLKRETQRSEDYLEAIFHLIQDKGYASTVDISETLHVKPPTVTDMIKKLATGGYLVHEPYRGMNLTDKGEKIAKSVITRHRIVMEFLLMLGVDEEVAYHDAEGIEHHTQPVTSYKIERLVDFLRKNPKYLKAIRDYVDDQETP